MSSEKNMICECIYYFDLFKNLFECPGNIFEKCSFNHDCDDFYKTVDIIYLL